MGIQIQIQMGIVKVMNMNEYYALLCIIMYEYYALLCIISGRDKQQHAQKICKEKDRLSLV